MRVLVTGHLGYIGVVLTPMLLNAGHEVIGYVRVCFVLQQLRPLRRVNDRRDRRA
jgi:nucleoside-diphosphate-sugar epimerase